MSPTNGVMFQAFTWKSKNDGTFWDTLAERANRLVEVGFTAVWLPPACKAQAGTADEGYGVYDLYDLGEFDQKGTVRTRYGTRDQYEACVGRLNDADLLTLADIVLNHRMGADETETFLAVEVDPDDRTRARSEPIELEAWTRFNFPGRGDTHSDFRWRWHHFNAVDQSADGEDQPRRVFRVANKNFADAVDNERGNFDYLMGCNHHLEQPDVRDELRRWARWMIDTTGVRGVRIDAAKHMAADFLKSLHESAAEHVGRDLFAVAEYATADVSSIDGFLDQTEGKMHAFDFPLQDAFRAAGQAGHDFDLRKLADAGLVACRPELSVTFVDNHDTDPAQGGGRWVDDAFKVSAYAFILLRKGGMPCVYAGDFDGGEDLTEFGEPIGRLMALRRRYNFGDQQDHFDQPERIAWVRTGDEQHPGAMVVVLGHAAGGALELATTRSQTQFVRAFGGDEARVTTDDQGVATFPVSSDGVEVWVTP